MNREELNWLLQTIKDAENAERFVLAQYERGKQFLTMATCHSTEYATTESSVGIA